MNSQDNLTSAAKKCYYCNKEFSSSRFRWCDDCLSKIQKNISALFNACSKEHRGAGGAAICICGAGCGGSSACNALNLLKSAIEGPDGLRREIADLFGWYCEPPCRFNSSKQS